MRTTSRSTTFLSSTLLLGALPSAVLGDTQILSTSGFTNCINNGSINVTQMNVVYNHATNAINFDVAGTSASEQNVTAALTFTAYGKQVYQKDFDPCNPLIAQLCPVPAGQFAASGNQTIPSEFASQIPAIAFSVPDLDGVGKIELKSSDGQDLACVQSSLGNGKTMQTVAVPIIAAGIAGAALVVSALSALASGGQPGTSTPSPTFGEVMGWFQSMAMNGMLSVQYPSVYQSFSTNFGFSTGLIPWASMQTSIDNFRKATGGNLTDDNYQFLVNNVTLVQTDGQSNNITKRSVDFLEKTVLYIRDGISTNVNGSSENVGGGSDNATSTANSKEVQIVHGIQGYVEELSIPQANTFMTVLLIFAIVIAAITVGILLFKVILEAWALFGSFPKKLQSFRKRYWWLLAKTITNLILILYGTWTLYCVYQFTNGDSWAAKVLAGVTLAAFTALLGFFTWKIWSLAHKYKQAEGDTSGLYEDKETWRKYSLFYENYRKGYWWLFVPAIVYMFARGCVIAGADGHGLVQSAGQLIIESLMLALLLFSRPYTLKSGNWINIMVQVVRILSVVCILVFVEELGIAQTTKAITGVVLIVMQSVLTGLLAILIAVNAIVTCCRENPHRRKRKEAEKLHRDLDTLTPLDARNSLLMDPTEAKKFMPAPSTGKSPLVSPHPMGASGTNFSKKGGYGPVAQEQHGLMSDAASMGGHDRSVSPAPWDDEAIREPRLPDLDQDTSYHRGRW
ncbi:MAG: hypothetical protein M1822_007281 [Bathelium mastoideum]|nr:MAG: hypothetical protein M1822_007281 [Bathelium mastoideum]